MPSFSSSSSIRAASEHFILNVKIVHELYHVSPSHVIHKVKGKLPKELDVLLLSDLIFIVSGYLNGQAVPADTVIQSALVRRLRNDFSANAHQLGINNISDAYIDEDDGHVKMTLTPSRSLFRTLRPHAILVSVNLCYIWKKIGNPNDSADSTKLLGDASPFADHLYLPFDILLKRVTEQLFTNQLVGRYPLIFGTWCRRLDMEAEFFPSVAQSIIDIMRRSPNPHFVLRCKRLIKTARARHQSVLQASAAALSMCFAPHDTEDSEESESANASILTPDSVLRESLEQLFRVGVPHTRFKVITAGSTLFYSSVGDDDQLVEPSQDDATFNSTEIDFPLIWPNLPDIDIDISTNDDIQQTVPNDLDSEVEDWPEEESHGSMYSSTWTSHSENSLINSLGIDSSEPRSLTSAPASSPPTESRYDDSFALDLGPDHELNLDMEDAEFPSLSCHNHSLYCRNEADFTFLGPHQEEDGKSEEFDALADADFEDEEWSYEGDMLFDLVDILDDSVGLGIAPLCVSQAPEDNLDIFQVETNAAEQEYFFGRNMLDTDVGEMDMEEDVSFTEVWDL